MIKHPLIHMKWLQIMVLATALVLPCLGSASTEAVQPLPEINDQITLKWQEFKELVHMDQKSVVLTVEEFQQLSRQTGTDIKPQKILKKGQVQLTREQFKTLLNSMIAPENKQNQLNENYSLQVALYNGVVKKTHTQVHAAYDVVVFKERKDKTVYVKLFKEETALKDVKLNGKPALLVLKNGWYRVVIDKSGLHKIDVRLSMAPNVKENRELSFVIPQVAITRLALTIEKPNLEIAVKHANKMKTYYSAGQSRVLAHCVPEQKMSISWKRKFADRKKGPAKIYAELFNLLSVEAGAIRVTSKVELTILQNVIMSLSLVVPEGYQVIKVEGGNKENWFVGSDKGVQILTIPFEYPREGKQSLTIKAEKMLSKETIGADFKGFQVLQATREVGYVAGEVKSDAEANVQELEGGEKLDFQKIPSKLSSLSSRPLLFAFKYSHHPYQVVVDIIKHEKEEALSAVIDRAEGITLLQKDGKLTNQVTYHIRNIWKQFLKIELPQDARIWSVYVDGKREKASQDQKGRLLIPLARSKRKGGKLEPFKVEIIYRDGTEKIGLLGQTARKLPKVDVLINKMNWSLYLPEEYRHGHFTGDLKSEDFAVYRPQPVKEPIPEGVMLSGRDNMRIKGKKRMKKEKKRRLAIGKALTLGAGRAQKKYTSEDKAMVMEMTDNLAGGMESERLEEVQVIQKDSAQPVPAPRYAPSPLKPEGDGVKPGYAQATVLGKAGLLSVRPTIPLSGTGVHLGKKIIDSNEELQINYLFAHESVIYTLWTLIMLIVLWVLYCMRRQLLGIMHLLGKMSRTVIKKSAFLIHPQVMPFLLYGIAVTFVFAGSIDSIKIYLVLLLAAIGASLIRIIMMAINKTLVTLIHPHKITIVLFVLSCLFVLDNEFFGMIPGLGNMFYMTSVLVGLFTIAFILSIILIFTGTGKKSKVKKEKEEIK